MTREVIHGADDVLRGVFWDLARIGDAGEPRYSESVLKRLAAKILDGRAHEPLVFRLCHLVRCAELASQRAGERYGWLGFFCTPQAGRADRAAGWMRARLPSPEDGGTPAAAAVDHLALRFEGRAEPVRISWGAIPLPAAFMEFLLNTLGYEAVKEGVASLLRPRLEWKELQDAANTLSRAVYKWLREHTRPVQESRDFDAIVGFLLKRGGGDNFSADDIEDEAILDFWRSASLETGSGFITYRKTFRAFLRFADALREGTLGGEGETGYISLGESGYEPPDPGSPGLERMRTPSATREAWVAADDEAISPLEEIESTSIKFLLAGEAGRLESVATHGRALAALARSLLREAVFGHAQGRISQALRVKAADVEAMIAEPTEVRYEDEAASYDRLFEHLSDLVAMAAFVLLGEGNGAAREVDIATLKRGRRALREIRRKGFERIRSREPDALESLRAAVPAIIALREQLSPLCARLGAGERWAARQREDEPVFRAQFIRIYRPDEAEVGESFR